MGKIDKIIIIVLLIALIIINIFIILAISNTKKIMDNNKNYVHENIEAENKNEKKDKIVKGELIIESYTGEYEVYQNDNYIISFMNYQEAVDFAKKYENSSVKKHNGNIWLWDNSPQYNVYVDENDTMKEFSSFSEAVHFANKNNNSAIFYRKNNKFIWNNNEPIKSASVIDNIAVISQYPELYRGCEVTSLAMLINYKGIPVNKMTLAEEIRKDLTPYSNDNGKIYYGNPNAGFVGDIYDSNKRGFGVYHRPIFELLSKYVGNDAVDLTGCSFSDLYFYLSKNIPVWVIVTSKFEPLSESSFENWTTPEGSIRITYSEHSVLVTGYDENYIYINDPMVNQRNIKKEKNKFIASWEQMGKQAVTYYDK